MRETMRATMRVTMRATNKCAQPMSVRRVIFAHSCVGICNCEISEHFLRLEFVYCQCKQCTHAHVYVFLSCNHNRMRIVINLRPHTNNFSITQTCQNVGKVSAWSSHCDSVNAIWIGFNISSLTRIRWEISNQFCHILPIHFIPWEVSCIQRFYANCKTRPMDTATLEANSASIFLHNSTVPWVSAEI